MNWTEIKLSDIAPVIPFFSALLGAAIAILAILLKARIDKKQAIQSWYEEYYITEGIDHLITHLESIELFLIDPKQEFFDLAGETGRFPFESVSKITVLLRSQNLKRVVALLNFAVRIQKEETQSAEILSPEEVVQLKTLPKDLIDRIERLRDGLLKVKVRKKAEIYSARNHSEVSKCLKELNQFCHETLKRYGLLLGERASLATSREANKRETVSTSGNS